MNLFLARRISRRNRTAKVFQRAVSKHDVSPGRSPWYSCPSPVRLMFRCFKHHAEGRVGTPEGCPENPQSERLEEDSDSGGLETASFLRSLWQNDNELLSF